MTQRANVKWLCPSGPLHLHNRLGILFRIRIAIPTVPVPKHREIFQVASAHLPHAAFPSSSQKNSKSPVARGGESDHIYNYNHRMIILLSLLFTDPLDRASGPQKNRSYRSPAPADQSRVPKPDILQMRGWKAQVMDGGNADVTSRCLGVG